MSTISHSLDPLFRPRSVAVIGASGTPGSVGSILIHNLMGNPFGGVVFPINPKRRSVHGVYCYPKLTAVPEPVDLAVIATPASTVPGVIQECVSHGVRGAIIISAGFAERGDEGRSLEREIRAIAEGHLRFIGPNCLGIIHPPSALNASFAARMALPGHLAMLSQSGAILTSILDWAHAAHIGFSGIISVGSMIDVDFADLIDYFGDDPQTRSILLYMESIGNVRKFLSAARAVARTKTIIVVKSGREEGGARAAASHTGALAGSDAVYDAAFRRAGILRVGSIPELFDMAEILATQPQPQGPALAIITNAGGPGVMATDALIHEGGHLAELRSETLTALNTVLPSFWSHANPIDILGDATPDRYRQAVEICRRDPGIQGLLVLLTPQAMTDPTETAQQLVPFAHIESKPILASWMGRAAVQQGRDLLAQAGIPTFEAPEAAVQAFLHMVRYRRNQELLYEIPEALPEDWSPDHERVRALLTGVRSDKRTLLTEAEAKEVLSAYGIPVVRTIPCRTVDEAVTSARMLGFPVVLKLLSRTITHKSDVGGVQLNLRDESAVRQAFETMRRNLASRKSDSDFEGVTVQSMIRTRGYELIVGSSMDPQFGPVILFGAGGVMVEVFEDRALGLPPINRTLARRLMERTRIYRALKGIRGQRAVPLQELEMLLVRFSQLLIDFRELREIDINPLLASSEQILALDARMVLTPSDLPTKQQPQLAIRAYPNQYTAPFRMNNGMEVIIRTIRPEDEPLIVELHSGHSERTIRMRYFSMVRHLSRDSLIRLCQLDYDRELALTGVYHDAAGRPHLLGVSRYYLHPETGTAEFAVVVGDAWQGQGLGRHLIERLIAIARERGVQRLAGLVLRENETMLQLVKEFGFITRPTEEDQSVEAVLELVPTKAQPSSKS